jgi:protein-glucosylgalactosylhydroxylysine glucosidase
MDGPISPPPVGGTAGNELPAYMSNGVVGLKVRDNPLSPGMALLSRFSGEHPERKNRGRQRWLPIRSPAISA